MKEQNNNTGKIKDLEDMKIVFDKYEVPFFFVYGALLGFHRDGDFIPHDDDIDLAITAKIDLKTRKAIGWTLYDLGFRPQQIAFNVFGRMEPGEIGYNGDGETGIIVCERNFKFSIFFFKEVDCPTHGKEMLCVPKLGALNLIASPATFYEKPGKLKIGKNNYLIPSPIEEYLTFTYGNWRDPLDRRHADTWFVQHPKDKAILDITGRNEVTIFKKK